MTLPDPTPLRTERIATSRRGPFAVVLAGLVVVALLAWKPWVGPAAASPSPSLVAARPTSSATLAPTPGPTAIPDPTPSVEPTPEVPTANVSWIVPFVQCGYAPGQHGARLLSSITLFPPLVSPSPVVVDGLVLGVKWHAVVESNWEQTLFTAPWERVSASRRRPVRVYLGPDAVIRRISIAYGNGPVGPTLVVRVEVVVEWFDDNNQLVRTANVAPTSYRHGAAGAILPEGCHTII